MAQECYKSFSTVPGLKAHITAADVAVLDAGDADVYGFDAVNGSRLYAWQHLSRHALTSIVWQLQQDGQLAKLTSLGRFPAGVHCLAAAAAHSWLLTASLDGLVVAWSTDSWQQMYRMKLSEPVAGIQFYAADKFLCTSGSTVRFFKLKREAEVWMEFSSPLTSLEPLQSGLLLATFADSSVRLLDCRTGATDKTAVTVVPQLSSAGLLQAAVSPSKGRLYALLTNGHVHVWELHVTRPPAFLEAWTLLEDEKCCSLAYMEGQGGRSAVRTMERTAAGCHGLNRRLVGRKSGQAAGRPVAAGLLPVTLLKVDTSINRLVAGGSKVVTVWDLATLTCTAEFGANEQHEDAVLGLTGSAALQHFVSCSRDGYMKVFDRSCRVKTGVFMAAPLAIVSFMNDDGDLLVAAEAAKRLLLVQASRYAVTYRHPDAVSTIFDVAHDSVSSAVEALGSSNNSSAGGSTVQPQRKPRPPLDLDDSRAKADLARALHQPLSGRLGLARCKTISRMVQTAAVQQACSCGCGGGGGVWDCALSPMQTRHQQQGIRHAVPAGSVWKTVHGYNLAAVPKVLQDSRQLRWRGNDAAWPGSSAVEERDGSEVGGSSYDGDGSSCGDQPDAPIPAAAEGPAAAAAPAEAADATNILAHATVFMEGSVSPAELQGLLRKSTTHHVTADSKRKDKCSKPKEKSIASAAGAAMRKGCQAVGKQAAPAASRTGALPGAAQIMMQRNRKKNKKKQQQTASPSLSNTAAHPLRGCGISSVAKQQQRKKGLPGPVYTSLLELLKHTTRDTAVLTELKSAEAHDMRQAAAMRSWMSVGSGVTGSSVVAAALRAAEVAASTVAAAVAPALDKN
eukprot:gene2849-3142_t